MAVVEFPAPEPVTESDLSPEFSEDALAIEFSSRHAGELRYCAQGGRGSNGTAPGGSSRRRCARST